MKTIYRLFAAGLFALTLAACTTDQLAVFNRDVATIEAKIASFIAQIKAQAPIILADTENTISLACGIVPTAQSEVANFQATIVNPSAKVQAALTRAAQALTAAQTSCNTYNAQIQSGQPITLASAVNFAITIWNAYQAGKAAYAAATAG